jgi:hypothetical protein
MSWSVEEGGGVTNNNIMKRDSITQNLSQKKFHADGCEEEVTAAVAFWGSFFELLYRGIRYGQKL